jgi:hypothetical protein
MLGKYSGRPWGLIDRARELSDAAEGFRKRLNIRRRT